MKRIYIQFPETIEAATTKKDSQNMVHQLEMIIERIKCEKDAMLYYSNENLYNFFEEVMLIEEIGEFAFGYYNSNIVTTISQLLQDTEHIDIKCDDKVEILVWDLSSKHTSNAPSFFKDIVTASEKDDNLLVINILNFNFSFGYDREKPFIPIIKDQASNKNLPVLCHVFFVDSFKSLETWLQERQGERNLNITDERHQEWSKAYKENKRKSPLRYDLRNESEQESIKKLLQTAITDKRDGERTSKDLINFDKEKNAYIWFESEGDNPQKQYHAYHLVKRNTYEDHKEAINKIPVSIKDLLEYRQSL